MDLKHRKVKIGLVGNCWKPFGHFLFLVTIANQPKDEGHLQQTPEGDI